MPSENDENTNRVPPGEQKVASVAEQTPSANGTAKVANKSEQGEKLTNGPKEKELSGKEKKDLAKAQKAAKRAAEKQKLQGQPAVALAVGNKGEFPKDAGRKGSLGSAPPTSKNQHKRAGSTSAATQPSLPHRQAPSNTAPVSAEAEKENKNVALFDHLYGHSRRTTVVGVGKDVHPAVLALGLQIRNYIICGSSARCVAMLLAFKRVRIVYTVDVYVNNSHTGHRIIHNSFQKFVTTPSHHTPFVADRLPCFLPTHLYIYGKCHTMAEGGDI